jgi:hypothetical protein
MREWLEIRDFSQGMNQQNAVTASDQPWDLQDVLISEKPELVRRGPFTDRAANGSGSNLNVIQGTVLAASTYQFLNTQAVVAVTSEWDSSNDAYWVSIYVITPNDAPVRKRFRIRGQQIDGVWYGARMADICGAWTDDAGDRADARPDAFVVTTDRGTYVVSYQDPADNDEGEINDYFQVASSYYPLANSSNELYTGRLKGSGFRTCANVGGYTFLAGRFKKDSNGSGVTGAGRDASFIKAAPRKLFWSKIFNSEFWKNKPGDIGRDGGSLTLPFTEAVRYMTELEGNLVIFTKNQIHTMSGSEGADPLGWNRQQRSAVGTIYPRTVSRYEDSLIFANADGVYQFSGYETICLTEDSIGGLYRKQFYQNVTNGQKSESPVQRDVVGIVIGDYYLLSLDENSGYAFCCYLPTNSWVRFSNIPMLAASKTAAEDDRAFGFMKSGNTTRIVRLDRMFVSDGTSQSTPPGLDTLKAADSPSLGPNLKIELRRYSQTGLGVPKLWRSIAVLYDSKALASGTGQINLSFAASPDKDDASWTALSPLLATGNTSSPRGTIKEVRQAFAATGSAIGVKLEEVGNLGQTNIASIELGYKELRRGRA